MMPNDITMAEHLINLAEAFRREHYGVVSSVPPDAVDNPGQWERIRIALRFRELPPVTQFQAILEGWDYTQCKAFTL